MALLSAKVLLLARKIRWGVDSAERVHLKRHFSDAPYVNIYIIGKLVTKRMCLALTNSLQLESMSACQLEESQVS